MNGEKVWNLTELSELEEQVLTQYETLTPNSYRSPAVSAIQKWVAIAAVAFIAMPMSISGIAQNEQQFSSPAPAISLAQSGIEKPPLDEMFSGRFDAEWTLEYERELLASVPANIRPLTKQELLEQSIDSIFYELEGRLPREEVERIVRQRKIV